MTVGTNATMSTAVGGGGTICMCSHTNRRRSKPLMVARLQEHQEAEKEINNQHQMLECSLNKYVRLLGIMICKVWWCNWLWLLMHY